MQSSFPFRYLGIPNNNRKVIEERIERKLSSWEGKHLSVGGMLVLINMFMLSLFEVPRGILEKNEYYRSSFFLSK
jgi:hypothetical protein